MAPFLSVDWLGQLAAAAKSDDGLRTAAGGEIDTFGGSEGLPFGRIGDHGESLAGMSDKASLSDLQSCGQARRLSPRQARKAPSRPRLAR